MRLYKWELKKLISAPAIWAFFALCFAFNILIIISDSYGARYANELSREIARTGDGRYTGIDDVFIGYETSYIADAFVRAYQLTGVPETLMREKYRMLQSAVERNAETGAGLDVYADAYTFNDVHRSLFRSTLFHLLTESALFALLAALFTLGYEHQQKTESLVYSSRTGRKTARHKCFAALTAAAAGYVLLTALTLSVYFIVWDYSGFWDANVSSMSNFVFDEAGQRPFITWLSLNVAQYLAVMLALGFLLTVVFCLVGSLAGLLTRNTYMGFIFVMLICLFIIAAAFFCANAGLGWVLLALLFSPAAAWITSGRWLTDMGGWAFMPFQETVTIAGNLLLFSCLTVVAAKRFMRKDVT